MSFLLDALRKSERNAARRAVPTIHSAEPHPDAALERPGPGGWWLLLLPVVVIGGWLLARHDGAVPAGARPAGSSSALVQSGSPGAVAVDEGLKTATERAPPPSVRPAGQASAAPGARTPVEMMAPATPDNRPGAETRVEPQAGPGATAAAVSNPAQAVVADESGVHASTESPPPREGGGSEVRTMPAVARAPAAARRNYIDYRQLPDHVRDQLPVFNMTVLVYAEQPSDRFILMNGGRQQEGDEPQPGLKLLEIRREGAVYLFQQYRFLVSR